MSEAAMGLFLVNDNHCGSCGRIRGVFTTLAAAQQFAAKDTGGYWTIERWVADEPLDANGLPNVEEISSTASGTNRPTED